MERSGSSPCPVFLTTNAVVGVGGKPGGGGSNQAGPRISPDVATTCSLPGPARPLALWVEDGLCESTPHPIKVKCIYTQ